MFDFQSLVSQEKAFCSQCLIVGDVNTLVLTLFSATAHCAERANSPSILEGVPEGRGSNIGILIPFFIVFVLIIIHNVVSDDFLSAEIETMKHLFVNLFPKRNLGHVADSAIFTRIGSQNPISQEIVVFDSNIVNGGHFFTRNSDILYYYPA